MDNILTLYFSAKSRINRLQYLMYQIPPALLNGYILYLYKDKAYIESIPPLMHFVSLGVIILMSYCLYILCIKRFHDCDCKGWWSLLLLLPVVGLLAWLWLLFYPGTKTPNRFGKVPL